MSNNLIESFVTLQRESREAWEEAKSLLQMIAIDWNSPHPSLGMTLDNFYRGLVTALELSGPVDEEKSKSIGAIVDLSPGFSSMIDSLTKMRDNSNSIRDYIKSANEAGYAITILDVNQLNDAANRQLNLGAHLKEIKNAAVIFVQQLIAFREFLLRGDVADLSSRIQMFHELSDQIKPILGSVKEKEENATSLVDKINSFSEKANALLQSIETVNKKSAEVNSNSETALNETNAKLAKIREVATEADKLRIQVEQYQGKYGAFDADLESRLKLFKEFEQANQSAQEQNLAREKVIDGIIEKSNQMIKGATNVGLANAFYNASEKYGTDAEKAKKAFYWSIGLLILSVIPLAAYVLPIDAFFVEGEKTREAVKLGGVLARAILLLPTVWLTTFAGHRYWSLFQLHREYSFKAAIAMSIDGFKQQSKQYEEEIAAAAFVGLAEKPDYSPPKESIKSPNPILSYLIKILQKRFGKMSGDEENK